MYTGTPFPELTGPIQETDKAEGFIDLCDQSALMFGQDRKIPVATRPVVRVRHYSDWVIVLPCTSAPQSSPSDFFELTDKRVMWTRPNDSKGYASYRYEAVFPSRLTARIGVMNQPARIELISWLKQKI